MTEITSYLFILLAILALAILVRWLTPSRGKQGENSVARILKKLPKKEYRVINDVVLPTPYGSSQIDHIVVSPYGIFVIETKNYCGGIYGTEHGEYWTKNVYGHKYDFYNPILQNTGHVTALRKNLKDYRSFPIFSIVAFSRQASLDVSIQEAIVVYWNQIPRVIRQFRETKLSSKQVESIYDEIVAINKASASIRKNHGQSIKSTKDRKFEAISSGRCPRCGGKLVARSGRYGNFYGCSNYPDCKYTLPTDY